MKEKNSGYKKNGLSDERLYHLPVLVIHIGL